MLPLWILSGAVLLLPSALAGSQTLLPSVSKMLYSLTLTLKMKP